MTNKHIELTKASRVKKEIKPFPCCQLSSLMLLLNLFRATCCPLLFFPSPQFLNAIENRCHQAAPFFA
jgi:hypothetical protein